MLMLPDTTDQLGFKCFPGSSVSKESACSAGDLGLIPGLGRPPGEGKGYPLQYSGLENSKDCIVHGVTKSRTRLSYFTKQRIPEWIAMPSSSGSFQPDIKPRSPAVQADSLLNEPPRKLKNTVLGNLSLLQGILPTEELNWDLLYCRRILYQLSYQGSPPCLQYSLNLIYCLYNNQ